MKCCLVNSKLPFNTMAKYYFQNYSKIHYLHLGFCSVGVVPFGHLPESFNFK